MTKSPDAIDDSIQRAISDATQDDVQARAKEWVQKQIAPWVKYNEYITVEIDTDTSTARVVPVNEL